MLKLIEINGKKIIFGTEMGSIECPKSYYRYQPTTVITQDVVVYIEEDGYFKSIIKCPLRVTMWMIDKFVEENIKDLQDETSKIHIKGISEMIEKFGPEFTSLIEELDDYARKITNGCGEILFPLLKKKTNN